MAERRPDGPKFPPELRSPKEFDGCRFRWHDARADWLKANGLKGALTEIRAMTNPELSARLVADPDYSIGTPRPIHPRRYA